MKKDTYFFPHDFGARNDPKIQKMIMTFGNLEGVGVYWCIIEMLYEQGGFIELDKMGTIAFQLHIDKAIVEKVINDFDLFEKDDKQFWSESVKRRLKKREELANKRRRAANNRWEKNSEDERGAHDEGKEDSGTSGQGEGETSGKPPKKGKDVDFDAIVDMYHTECKNYPRVVRLSDARKNKIRIRVEEMNGDLTILQDIFKKMEASKFLRGDNPKGWKATFDWVFENEKNWVKIYEGNYDNKPGTSGGNNANDEWK